jgi:hypothetical protein
MGATVTGPNCRHCKRPIYRLTDGSWTLVYVEYADPWRCDARGDGAVLSGLGHEPVRWRISTTYEDELSAAVVTEDPDRVRRFARERIEFVLTAGDRVTGFNIERLDEEE